MEASGGIFHWIVGRAAMSCGVEEVKLRNGIAEMTPVGHVRKPSFVDLPSTPDAPTWPPAIPFVPFETGQ